MVYDPLARFEIDTRPMPLVMDTFCSLPSIFTVTKPLTGYPATFEVIFITYEAS